MDRAKLARHYQALAVLLLNTAVLTALVLAVLHCAFPLEDSIWNQNLDGRRLSQDLVPEHYYLTGAEETRQIRKTLDDYVLAGHWQVHPWTGLINRQFASGYLNVDAHGQRASAVPSSDHAGQPPFEIWAFGGSTLFGWGVSDSYTVPSQLQAALQDRMSQRQVRVSNYGVPWYNSSHEVVLFATELRRASRAPDAVVFLDGLNDLIHRIHYRTDSPLHRQLEQAWERRLDDLFAPPPWVRLTPSFPLFRAALAFGSPSSSTLGGLPGAEPAQDLEVMIRQAAKDYLTNRRVATAISREFGITPYFMLQPVPMWLNAARDTTVDASYNAFSRLTLSPKTHDLYDLRGALAKLEPRYAMTVERTGVHYSDMAGQVLAAAMADVILGPDASDPTAGPRTRTMP